MYGFASLASAIVIGLAFVGVGAGDSLMENLDQRLSHRPGSGAPDGSRGGYAEEQVVEGHTTYAVLDMTQERDSSERPPPPPKKEKVECEQFQPADPVWPIYERCEVTVGPIETPTEYRVEEVHAEVGVTNTGLPVVGNPDDGFWDGVFALIPWV